MWQGGNDNDLVKVDEDSTPRGGSVTYTSNTNDVQRYRFVSGTCFADQAGTLYIEFSDDGVNWDGGDSYVYAANAQLAYELRVPVPLCRARFVNGVAAQGTFRFRMWGSRG